MRASGFTGGICALLLAACSSSSGGGEGGGGQGKMYATCSGTSECVLGLQCFQSQCLVRLSTADCSAAGDRCEAAFPGSGNGAFLKCTERCSSNTAPSDGKLGDECELFACMNELGICGGEDDPNLASCVNAKGWT